MRFDVGSSMFFFSSFRQQLAKGSRTRHSYSQMPGRSFEYSGVRFLLRFRLWEKMMRTFASLLIRRLTYAVRHSLLSRPHAAESAAAAQCASQPLDSWTSRLARSAEPASDDALRLNHNSVNLEDLYGISFIRERLAASARRQLPQEGRRSPVSATIGSETRSETIALGQNHGFFQQRKSTHRKGGTTAEWLLFRQQQQPIGIIGSAAFAPA